MLFLGNYFLPYKLQRLNAFLSLTTNYDTLPYQTIILQHFFHSIS